MKVFCVLILAGLFIKAKAQVPDHVPLMTSTWDILELKTYKTNAKGKYVVFFPTDLQELNKTVVELPGYMIPIKTGLTQQVFLLSVLPVLQCQFCGQSNIPSMVEVHLVKPANYLERPVQIKGTLNLNNKNDGQSEFLLTNATLEELK